jgi:hypothetical protein
MNEYIFNVYFLPKNITKFRFRLKIRILLTGQYIQITVARHIIGASGRQAVNILLQSLCSFLLEWLSVAQSHKSSYLAPCNDLYRTLWRNPGVCPNNDPLPEKYSSGAVCDCAVRLQNKSVFLGAFFIFRIGKSFNNRG